VYGTRKKALTQTGGCFRGRGELRRESGRTTGRKLSFKERTRTKRVKRIGKKGRGAKGHIQKRGRRMGTVGRSTNGKNLQKTLFIDTGGAIFRKGRGKKSGKKREQED